MLSNVDILTANGFRIMHYKFIFCVKQQWDYIVCTISMIEMNKWETQMSNWVERTHKERE